MYHKLIDSIDSAQASIGIIGLGYVGLPLAVEFASKGFKTVGFETDSEKIKQINSGVSYIADVQACVLNTLVAKKLLRATGLFSELTKMDAIIICVPTPLRKSKDPDVSYIISATESIKKHIRKGQLVILESTTYPGTTSEIALPMLEGSKLKCGRDFFLAFSPERVDPSNSKFSIRNTPKVVGGITKKCTALAKALYLNVADRVIEVSTSEAAEMVKLLENTFRAVNIALVNEVALMCDKLKLDVWEIIDAAASKPFGYMPFYPGPGIGGHCIPLDPHYLSWKLKTLNFYSRFIELAGEMNSKMPEHLVEKIVNALNSAGKSILKAKILILGVAYKRDVSDVRESPALDVIQLLLDKNASVSFYDPFVSKLQLNGKNISAVKDLKKIRAFDAAVIVTNHTKMDYKFIVSNSKLVIDSRNATKGILDKKIIKL